NAASGSDCPIPPAIRHPRPALPGSDEAEQRRSKRSCLSVRSGRPRPRTTHDERRPCRHGERSARSPQEQGLSKHASWQTSLRLTSERRWLRRRHGPAVSRLVELAPCAAVGKAAGYLWGCGFGEIFALYHHGKKPVFLALP